jgi:predicted metal-dependent phosphoesterase TrpH
LFPHQFQIRQRRRRIFQCEEREAAVGSSDIGGKQKRHGVSGRRLSWSGFWHLDFPMAKSYMYLLYLPVNMSASQGIFMRLIDLHCHSTASDGSDEPAELVRKAVQAGLAALAVTDHDSLAGLDEAQQAAEETELEFIRGCEISARGESGEMHILGLWIPREHPNLKAFEGVLRDLRDHRSARNQIMVERLRKLGCSLSYDEVLAEAGGESVGRPHIARVLMRKGYAKSAKEVFTRYLGSKCSAYEPKKVLQPEEAVELLLSVGATAALAHPKLIKASDAWLEAMVVRLKTCGLSAMEAYHSEHSEANTRFCAALAARHGLALCGGSDYHGRIKPSIALGTGRGGLRVPWSLLDQLKQLRREQGLPV